MDSGKGATSRIEQEAREAEMDVPGLEELGPLPGHESVITRLTPDDGATDPGLDLTVDLDLTGYDDPSTTDGTSEDPFADVDISADDLYLDVSSDARLFPVDDTAPGLDPAEDPQREESTQPEIEVDTFEAIAELEARLEGEADPDVRMRQLKAIIELADSVGDGRHAARASKRLLEHMPGDHGAFVRAERHLRDVEDWEALSDLYLGHIEHVPDSTERTRLLRVLARVLEDRVGDRDQALEAWLLAWTREPLDVDTTHELERLAAEIDGFSTLIDGVTDELHQGASPEHRRAYRLACARWHLRAREASRAAVHIDDLLDATPGDVEVLSLKVDLLRKERRGEDLIAALDHLREHTEGVRLSADLQIEAGDVYRCELDRPRQALARYLVALELAPGASAALEGMRAVYEEGIPEDADTSADAPALEMVRDFMMERSDYEGAARMLSRIAHLTQETRARIEHHLRAAQLRKSRLDDTSGATRHYRSVLELDPDHVQAFDALTAIHRDTENWVGLAELIESVEHRTSNVKRRARLLAELAELYEHRHGDAPRSLEAFERLLEVEPGHEQASLRVGEQRLADGNVEEAARILREGAARSSLWTRGGRLRVYLLLGVLSARAGNDVRTVEVLEKAAEYGPLSADALWELSVACARTEQHEKTIKWTRQLLVHHLDEMGPGQAPEAYHRIGVAARAVREPRPALDAFHRALEQDPDHRPTLGALRSMHEERGDYRAAAEILRRLVDSSDGPDERRRLLLELGDLTKERLRSADQALDIYAEALRLEVSDRTALFRIFTVYQETQQWSRAVEMLDRIQSLEENPDKRARYVYAAGVICRDELHAPERALEKFEQALDVDPKQLRAFEAIDKLLTHLRDWKSLERAYRRMLRRSLGKGDAALEFNLWHNLGLIYRDRKKDFRSAAEAFRAAARLRPNDAAEQRILAEVYARVPEGRIECIAEYHGRLDRDPSDEVAYHALFRMYGMAGAGFQAWCAARALVFLGKADAEERAYYDNVRPRVKPPRRLSQEAWFANVRHPDESRTLGRIFQALAGPVHDIRKKSDTALGLSEDALVDPSSSPLRVARLHAYAAQVMGLSMVPRLFIREDVPGGLVHASTAEPPAVVCGANAAKGLGSGAQAFLVARHLCYIRSEHFIGTLLRSPGELLLALEAAMRLVGVQPASSRLDPKTVETARKELAERLDARRIVILRDLCPRLAEANLAAAVVRFVRAMERTACRAGFLLAGDLSEAAEVIRQLPPEGACDLSVEEKLLELVRYSVSEPYFELVQVS